MTYDSFLAFVIVAATLALVPGPTVTVIIANSLKYGSHAGLLNVLGTQVGVIIWLGIAALGLDAAVKLMGVWFDVLRYVGSGYLIWLGIKLFMSKGDFVNASERARPKGSFFLQGFVVIMSNPKMLLLFGALIPPFIPQGADVMRLTVVMGITFMAIAAVGDTAYAVLAGRAGSWLSQRRVRAIEVISGSCLIGGAAWMVLKGR
jgi:threonine/homoserine/homoserine lactone efflux protein